MAGYSGKDRKRGEDEPARLNQDRMKLELVRSMAEYAGSERRSVGVELARLNQDIIQSVDKSSVTEYAGENMINLEAESIYDVFLSFTGSDNLFGFVDYLHHSLSTAGIRVFRGLETVSTFKELRLLVYSSKIYMPIFSRNYARSPRCLDVLALMVKHTSRSGRTKKILPVFYDVERFKVKLEKSLYRDALEMHRGMRRAEKVEQWKKALVGANEAEGWESSSYKSQQELITLITREISLKLKREHEYLPEDLSYDENSISSSCTWETRGWSLIGLIVTFLCFFFRLRRRRIRNRELEESQVLQVISLLDMEVNDIRIVGIHGRDGIGKTALAKIIYKKFSLHFDACSFLVEIGEMMRHPGGVQYLQTKLIFDILKREYEVASAFEGVQFLKEIFRNMKVLLVLDDLEDSSLLKKFVGPKVDWFGSGSRIIVTSKERSVLQGFLDQGLAHTYDVSPINDNRAFDLFWQYAMGKSYKLHPYVEIANKIVKAAEGLPLLLKVFGSFLHGKGQEEWIIFKDLVQQFQEDYQKILRIIYEALDQKQKQMYLDIACFLPDVNCRIASYMWHDYDCPRDEIEVLRCMSLIKMEEKKISMHSMLRYLARNIIYEGFHDPRTHVRFYIPVITHDTKKRKKGTDNLNTIMAGFEIVPSTIFLSLGRTDIGGRFADALLNVRWLHWQACPQDFEVTIIHLENLVILDLSWSKVTESWGGWKGIKMKHLKVLNLTGCADLLVTPSFSCYPKLEILILERCSRLVHLDHSINDLKLLVTLNLKFCSELNMLPAEMDGMNALRELLIDGTSVRELPASIGKLFRLEIVSATNCFSLVHVPNSVCELKALRVLALDNAKIPELPGSIGDLGELRCLSLRNCHGLGKLPESIEEMRFSLVELDISSTGILRLPHSINVLWRLKVLKMDSCFLREFPRYIGGLFYLEEVHASWSRNLEGAIPTNICHLRHLRELKLRGTRISSLPSEIQLVSSLQTLDLLHCDNLKELPPLPSNLINLYVNPDVTQKM